MTDHKFELPDGARDSDPRWQCGHADGGNAVAPTSVDPVYVSGWCHGHNEANQCSQEESESAYQQATGKNAGF